MTDTTFDHPLPWTESEYFALGETMSRVELIDGCLLISPHDDNPHQFIMGNLLEPIRPSARSHGFRAIHRINLRLGPGRVTNPDLVVDDGDWDRSVVWHSGATIVGEVVSETSALTDHIVKRQVYAEAGIPWYLLVEPDFPDYRSIRVRMLRLAGDHYVKHLVPEHGETLKSDLPFPFAVSTEALLDNRDSFPVEISTTALVQP